MQRASAVSPFAEHGTELPWLTWTKQETLHALREREDETCPAPATPPVQPVSMPAQPQMIPPLPVPNHRRYDAVIDRMKNASRQIGSYSAWNT